MISILGAFRKRDLEDFLLKEMVHWRQISGVKWIKQGNCNSKFFHRVANGRRKRKITNSLVSEEGLILDNNQTISEEILNFSRELYSKPLGASWRMEI